MPLLLMVHREEVPDVKFISSGHFIDTTSWWAMFDDMLVRDTMLGPVSMCSIDGLYKQ